MDTGFTDDQRDLLSSVLDVLLPPRDDGRTPGAGALGLAAFVEAEAARDPALGRAIGEILAALAAQGFADLATPDRVARLQALSQSAPEPFGSLVVHAYRGYYSDPRVLEALGLEPRPPFPKGYAVPPTDFSLLDPVRRREKLYRDC